MKLGSFIRALGAPTNDATSVEVSGIAYDSRRVTTGDVFVALVGTATDGRRFAGDAARAGAVAVIAEEALPGCPVPVIVVDDAREAMAEAARIILPDPFDTVRFDFVTGTNGKTTVTYLVEAILSTAGRLPGIIGTIDHRWGTHRAPSSLTTPESVDIVRLLGDMARDGVDYAIIEASSHAIELERVRAMPFSVGAFTNLSQDHLDYHGSMEAYAQVKRRIFLEHLATSPRRTGAVVNLDDPVGAALAADLSYEVVGVSLEGTHAAIHTTRCDSHSRGFVADVATPWGPVTVEGSLPGTHNVMNALVALGIAGLNGVGTEHMARGIAGLTRVPGRLDPVANDLGIDVLVDYAHTDDALANVLTALQAVAKGRILTVFGCGGDRDRAKRPKMGAVARSKSDRVFVTSDNPRTETPTRIIDDILTGIEGHAGDDDVIVNADRGAAIAMAIEDARPGDIVLIAGKGHEDYQILGTTTIHFDDREVAAAALATRKERDRT